MSAASRRDVPAEHRDRLAHRVARLASLLGHDAPHFALSSVVLAVFDAMTRTSPIEGANSAGMCDACWDEASDDGALGDGALDESES